MQKDLAKKLSRELRFSYFSSKYWLELLCEHKYKNNEDLVYIEKLDEPGKWILQYTPHNPKNLHDTEIMWATEDEINFIKANNIEILKQELVMSEYFYKNSDLVSLAGSKFSEYRRYVKKFEETYKYSVVHDYDKDKVTQFLEKWDQGQKLKTLPYNRGLKFCYHLLDFLGEDEDLKATYVLIEDELVGFTMGEYLYPNHGIALHQKVNYEIKGLGRWLKREQAKYFKGIDYMAFGGSMGDPGVEIFKESLNPYKKEPYYHLTLGRQY